MSGFVSGINGATPGRLTAEQVAVLLRPIKPGRVQRAQGQSHVPAYDVTAHLSRIFGFDGWDKEIRELTLVGERAITTGEGDQQRTGWWVTYRCVMRLVIRDVTGRVALVREDAATGTASNLPSYGDAHDFACKNSISYALKRCAKDLGDQFGLSLYGKGSVDALVQSSLIPGTGDLARATVQNGAVLDSPDTVPEGVDPTTGEVAEEPADPVTDVEWFADFGRRIDTCPNLPELRGLWSELRAMAYDGRVAKADHDAVSDVLKARADELTAQPDAVSA